MSEIKGHPGISSAVGGVLTEAEASRRVIQAESNVRAIQKKINDEIAVARLDIEGRLRGETQEAAVALAEAREALRRAKDATPDHPWTGHRVIKMRRAPGQSSWTRSPQMVEHAGIVETVRSTTEFPANTSSYSQPAVGSAIVRLLTKSGGTGLRFETMWGEHHGWKLAAADTSEGKEIPGGTQ